MARKIEKDEVILLEKNDKTGTMRVSIAKFSDEQIFGITDQELVGVLKEGRTLPTDMIQLIEMLFYIIDAKTPIISREEVIPTYIKAALTIENAKTYTKLLDNGNNS